MTYYEEGWILIKARSRNLSNDRFFKKVDRLSAEVDRFSKEVDKLVGKVDRLMK